MNGILLNQGGAGAVESVNGQTGEVTLSAAEIGAIHSINGKEGTDIDLEPSDLYPGLQINDDRFFYQSHQNVYTVCDIDRDGLRIGGQSFDNPDITLDIQMFDDIGIPLPTKQTHKLSQKADKATTLQGYGIEDAYTKDEVNSKLSAIYKYKGTKDYYFQLPTKNEIGDVYNIIYASGEYYNTYRHRSYNIGGVVSLDVYWSNANGIFITVDYDNNKNNLYTQHFEGKDTIEICIDNLRLESGTSFTLPILKVIPAEPTSGVYLNTEFCQIFINANDPNFSKAYEGDSQYETYYDYILAMLNGWSEDTESIYLYFNNEYQYILSEPYLVKDGDNVVWNGTGWDVLGGTWDGLKQIIKENLEERIAALEERIAALESN